MSITHFCQLNRPKVSTPINFRQRLEVATDSPSAPLAIGIDTLNQEEEAFGLACQIAASHKAADHTAADHTATSHMATIR